MAGFSERLLLWIFRNFPPSDPIFKEPTDRPAAEYEDEKHFGFYRYFGQGPEMFEGKNVLDLGSGFGGRAVAYEEYGARSVVGVDPIEEQVWYSEAFAKRRSTKRVRFVVGVGEKIPFRGESFDLVTMNDVMEHVILPGEVLQECCRVLRPGGQLAVVFPPYFDLVAGSHLHGYATSFPGLHVVFPTHVLKSAASVLLDERGMDYKRFLREVATDTLWNLNGLTIRAFRRLVSKSCFRVDVMRYIGHLDHRLSDHEGVAAVLRRPLFLLAELPAQIPFVQEICCSRVCALCRK